MKKLMLVFLCGMALSCNNAAKEDKKETATAATETTAPDYPYKIKQPDNWEIGSSANTMNALTALKKWEEGKMDESITYFGDSIKMQFDGLEKKMAKDSAKTMLAGAFAAYKNVKVVMHDWESVISKDKKEEWVTVWYTQSWDTPKSGRDSVAIINDMEFKNGKIVTLAEYTRKFH